MVVKNGENVVDPSENVVVVQKNVVGGGIKTQWAALSAARQMALEKPLSFVMAPRGGFEPTTKGLTVPCSTTELPRNIGFFQAKEVYGGSLLLTSPLNVDVLDKKEASAREIRDEAV